MATGTGNFESSLGRLLAANIFEVNTGMLRFAQQGFAVNFDWYDAVARVHKVNDVQQRLHGVHVDAAYHRCFPRIDFWNDQLCDLLFARFNCDRQSSAHAAHTAVKRELAHEHAVLNLFLVEPAVGSEDPERHRQIEARPFLTDVSGREIHRDVSGRNVVTAVAQGGTNSITAFPYSRIR